MKRSDRPCFAAVLMAGGQSKRMGRDKAKLDWNGQMLWEHQLAKLAAVGPDKLILSARAEQKLETSSAELLLDPPGNQGPLPALARCLESAQMPLLALAVDMPHMTTNLLYELVQLGMEAKCGAVFRGAHGFEPLCALYPPNVLPMLHASLESGNLRLQVFVQSAVDAGLLRVIPLSKEREALFFNLNTPADLA